MLGRGRRAIRVKIQRALSEVVAESDSRTREHLENLHRQTLTELQQSGARIQELQHRVDHLEQQVRRDLTHAMDSEAVGQSARFIVEHMPTVPLFWDPQATLRFALSHVAVSGLALEFGVATGSTLRIITELLHEEHEVYGFDVFSGLPQTWRTGFPAGEFAQDALPEVPGAELISGLFEETLPGFLAEHRKPIAFLHLDADLYSSTATVLDLVERRLIPGTVIVFDEFFNYPGWQEHEYRAWREFVDRTGIEFEYLGYTANHEQVVARVTVVRT